ncbi:MAG: hypothetical protein AAF211_00390, partial [Myxococcota bacterium]
MLEIVGAVVDDQGAPAEGVLVRLEGSADGGEWEIVAATMEPTSSDGMFQLPVPENPFAYGRLVFTDTSETVLVADPSLQDELEFPMSTPPMDITVPVWPPPDGSGGEPEVPTSITGSLTNQDGGSVDGGTRVALYGDSGAGEYELSVVETFGDGTFIIELDGIQATTYRIEFGPEGESYLILSGIVTWAYTAFPTIWGYQVTVPPPPDPAPQTTPIDFSGRIRTRDGRPLPGQVAGNPRPDIRIQVDEVQLGQSPIPQVTLSPGADGSFSDSASIVVTGTAICLTVVAEAYISGSWVEITRPVMVVDAPSALDVDLVIDDERLRTVSEAQSTQPILTELSGIDLTSLTDQDYEIAAARASTSVDMVKRRVAAENLRTYFTTTLSGPLIDVDYYYALLSRGFPEEPLSFASQAQNEEGVRSALLDASKSWILLPAQVEGTTLDSVVSDFSSLIEVWDSDTGEGGTAGLLSVGAPTLTTAQITAFVDAWYDPQVNTNPETFFDDMEASPPTGLNVDAVKAARRALAIAEVCGNHRRTVELFVNGLQDPPGTWVLTAHTHHPEWWTAEIGESAWQSIADRMSDTELPEELTGATLADRRLEWATQVWQRAQSRFSPFAARGDMERALLSATPPTLGGVNLTPARNFLTDNDHTDEDWRDWNSNGPEHFDFAETYLPRYFVDPGFSDETAQQQMLAFQRLYALAPPSGGWNAMAVMWSAGFRSAYDLVSVGSQKAAVLLQQATSAPVAGELPLQPLSQAAINHVISAAVQRSQLVDDSWQLKFSQGAAISQYAGAANAMAPIQLRKDAQASTDLDTMYTMALCGCVHCQSVLSPAAYLLDTLLWIQKSLGDEHYTALTVDRRPDLLKIVLDCHNTHTLMPYVDLAIEVMEQLVAIEDTQTSYTLDQLPASTTREADALLVYPEHGDRPEADVAYGMLKDAHYPPQLPYDLPLDEMRTYLGQAGVTLVEFLDKMNPLAAGTVEAVDIAVIGLGGTQSARTKFWDGTASAYEGNLTTALQTFWGNPPPVGLEKIDVLMPAILESDFQVVLDLLRTRYLNGDLRLGVWIDGDDPQACDPDNLHLQYVLSLDLTTPDPDPPREAPKEWLWARLAAFRRLQDWTGWMPLHLDKALSALGVAPSDAFDPANPPSQRNGPPNADIDDKVLVGLWGMKQLLASTGLAPRELFSWWTGLDTYLDRLDREDRPVEVPLYDARFLDPYVVGESVASDFALTEARDGLVTTPLPAIEDRYAAIAAALRISEAELIATRAYVESTSGAVSFNLDSFWRLFRWSSLARAAGLDIVDVERWIAMTGLNPLEGTPGILEPQPSAVQWFEALAELREHDLSVSKVAWIFGNLPEAAAVHGPSAEDVEKLVQDILAELNLLAAEITSLSTDERTLRAALLDLELDQTAVDNILQVVVWDYTGSVPAEADRDGFIWAIGTGVVNPTELAALVFAMRHPDDPSGATADPLPIALVQERMKTLHTALLSRPRADRARNIVTGKLEAAFPAL